MRCPTLQVLNAASRRTRCRRSGDIIIVIYLWCDARCLPTRGPGAWSGYCDAGQECWNLGRSEVVAIAIQDNYHQNTADRQVQHAEFRPVIVINRCIESIYYKEISSHIYISYPVCGGSIIEACANRTSRVLAHTVTPALVLIT